MNDPDLVLRTLLRAGRPAGPPAGCPPGFVQRVMQRVRAASAVTDPQASWAAGLWRCALGGLGVAALAGLLLGRGPAEPGFSPDPADLAEPDLLASVLVEALENGVDEP
ncbi:MAG: hypothetical protein ACKO3N_12700 [Verrucomicrobiota bacterium]